MTLQERNPDFLPEAAKPEIVYKSVKMIRLDSNKKEKQMEAAAKELAFEEANSLRDKIKILKEMEVLWL